MAVAAVARCGPPTRAADGAKTANGESPSRLSLSLASASPSSSPPLPSHLSSVGGVVAWCGDCRCRRGQLGVADHGARECPTRNPSHLLPPCLLLLC